MKKAVFAVLAAALIACADALAGVGATTNWVARYVSDYVGRYVGNAISNSPAEMAAVAAASVATTNGVTTVSAGNGEYVIVATWENATRLALTARDCTAAAEAAGITDGERWAIGDDGGYRGTGVPDIVKTPTNYVCGAFASTADIPIEFRYDGGVAFKTSAQFVTPSKAREIRGE